LVKLDGSKFCLNTVQYLNPTRAYATDTHLKLVGLVIKFAAMLTVFENHHKLFNVKVQLPLSLIKHHAMLTYGGWKYNSTQS
jgi:hypothetical protein